MGGLTPEEQTMTAPPPAVAFDTLVLTKTGWKPILQLTAGEQLVHPLGRLSQVAQVLATSRVPMMAMEIYDGTTLVASSSQLIHVDAGRQGPPVTIAQAARSARSVTAAVNAPFDYGDSVLLPMPPGLLGMLLGDGYLRRGQVQWCNQADEMRPLILAELPPRTRLGEMKIGKAGTGSSAIIGEHGRNPVVTAAADLGLLGKRAWEKFIPEIYLQAPLPRSSAATSGTTGHRRKHRHARANRVQQRLPRTRTPHPPPHLQPRRPLRLHDQDQGHLHVPSPADEEAGEAKPSPDEHPAARQCQPLPPALEGRPAADGQRATILENRARERRGRLPRRRPHRHRRGRCLDRGRRPSPRPLGQVLHVLKVSVGARVSAGPKEGHLS
jgi:hypothetical protein